MSLTDAQIERYSRQIIVPRLGGRGQERILASRIVIGGEARDIEAPLAYLVGAGVGVIGVRLADDKNRFDQTIAEMRQLNSDVTVSIVDKSFEKIDLALVFVGSETTLKLAEELVSEGSVVARLDAPGKIAVIPDVHGARVADASMLGKFGARADAADFIAMLATAEAFKLVAGYSENPSRAIIEFDGYVTKSRVLA
jgi:D-arabinose 1-dehydrogenase-like Zn-dependent alcohol dehydrogenase